MNTIKNMSTKLRTTNEFLSAFKLIHPIVGAPMANISGGKLASATTLSGGLGFIGVGYKDSAWLSNELELAELELERGKIKRQGDSQMLKLGLGFITFILDKNPSLLDLALQNLPCAIWFSFGNYKPYLTKIKEFNKDIKVFVQVDSVKDAIEAAEIGADVIVGQGLEAGGHGPKFGTTTFSLIPEICDNIDKLKLKHPVPYILAAGGVTTWRHLAGALSLGSNGVVLGTALTVAEEALTHPEAKKRIVEAEEGGRSTLTTLYIDKLRKQPWDLNRYTARALKNKVFQNEVEPKITEEQYKLAMEKADFDKQAIFAGLGIGQVDLVTSTKLIIDKIISGFYYHHCQTRQRRQWVPLPKL